MCGVRRRGGERRKMKRRGRGRRKGVLVVGENTTRLVNVLTQLHNRPLQSVWIQARVQRRTWRYWRGR